MPTLLLKHTLLNSIGLILFTLVSFTNVAISQETNKTEQKVIITIKKINEEGKEVTEKIIKEGIDIDQAMIDQWIKDAKKDAKEIDVRIEKTSNQTIHKKGTRKTLTLQEDVEEKLKELGIKLPTLGKPVANYVHAVTSNNWVFLAGKGPRKDDGKNIVGKLGKDLSIEQGYEAARWAGINLLAALKGEIGDLNRVLRIIKVKGMVNATSDFVDHSKVINGFSDLMVAVFGDRGKHARAAVGMNSLPGNMAVEIEVVVEIE